MTITLVDAFDLPDWLGTEPVVVACRWQPRRCGRSSAACLHGHGGHRQPLDLLAVDAAYPRVVCPDAERSAAHQAWQFGEVVLLVGRRAGGRSGAGTRFDANLACETLRRVARAVGAPTGNFTVRVSRCRLRRRPAVGPTSSSLPSVTTARWPFW